MSSSLTVDNPKNSLFNLEDWYNIRYQTLTNSKIVKEKTATADVSTEYTTTEDGQPKKNNAQTLLTKKGPANAGPFICYTSEVLLQGSRPRLASI